MYIYILLHLHAALVARSVRPPPPRDTPRHSLYAHHRGHLSPVQTITKQPPIHKKQRVDTPSGPEMTTP